MDEDDRPLGLAATVALLRDGDDGVEVLLLERPHDRGSFAGAWVFPGGGVDPEDGLLAAGVAGGVADGAVGEAGVGEAAALRRAAVRETREETGLEVADGDLVAVSRWHPPREAQKRLTTSFFAVAAPGGEPVLSPDEAVAFRWLSPERALEEHGAGRMLLFPPTWVTLHGLAGGGSVRGLLDRIAAAGPAEFATRFAAGMRTALWQGDAGYGDDALLGEPGGRHRLEMASLPWVYLVDPVQ